jgi:hypothetical protein
MPKCTKCTKCIPGVRGCGAEGECDTHYNARAILRVLELERQSGQELERQSRQAPRWPWAKWQAARAAAEAAEAAEAAAGAKEVEARKGDPIDRMRAVSRARAAAEAAEAAAGAKEVEARKGDPIDRMRAVSRPQCPQCVKCTEDDPGCLAAGECTIHYNDRCSLRAENMKQNMELAFGNAQGQNAHVVVRAEQECRKWEALSATPAGPQAGQGWEAPHATPAAPHAGQGWEAPHATPAAPQEENGWEAPHATPAAPQEGNGCAWGRPGYVAAADAHQGVCRQCKQCPNASAGGCLAGKCAAHYNAGCEAMAREFLLAMEDIGGSTVEEAVTQTQQNATCADWNPRCATL